MVYAVEPEVAAVDGNVLALGMAAPDTGEAVEAEFLRLYD
jgi:hypothetical protein